MEIKTVAFKRIKNLGNYESEHLEFTADLEPGDDVETEVNTIKELVYDLLGVKKDNTEESESLELRGF